MRIVPLAGHCSARAALLAGTACAVLAGAAADAQIRYVDGTAPLYGDGTSWAAAYKYLADAMDNATPGMEIRIAGGVYQPDRTWINPNGHGGRWASFNLSGGITLKGGYAGLSNPDPNLRDPNTFLTVLSGDLLDNDHLPGGNAENSYHVVKVSGPAAANVIDGLAIANGNANGQASDSIGGGALVTGGTPNFVSVGFWNNRAASGGALKLQAPLFNNTIAGCTFYANSSFGGSGIGGGGAIDVVNGSIHIAYCNFIGNSAEFHGAAVFYRPGSTSATFTMSYCTVAQNWTKVVGAVMIFTPNKAIVSDCDFADNSAEIGPAAFGAFHKGSTIIRSNFHGNAAGTVGAVALWANTAQPGVGSMASSTFWNNTSGFTAGGVLAPSKVPLANLVLAQNVAQEHAGGIGDPGPVYHSTVVANSPTGIGGSVQQIRNSLLWGNSPAQISAPASAVITHNLVQGGWLGTGNFHADPLFVAWDAHYLRLQDGSPGIDAGSLAQVPADHSDVDGDGNTTEPLPMDIESFARVVNDVPDVGAYEGFEGYTAPAVEVNGIVMGQTVELVAGGGVPGVGAVGATLTNESSEVAGEAILTQVGFDPHPGASGYTEDGLVAALWTSIPLGQHRTQIRIPITLFTLYPHGDLLGMRVARFDPEFNAWRMAVAMNKKPAVNGDGASPVGTHHALYSFNGSPVFIPTALGDHGFYWQVPEFKGFIWANVDVDGDFGIGRDLCGLDFAPGGGDGVIDGLELGLLLASWGSTGPGLPADLDGDGIVGPEDLGILLGNWGGCVGTGDSGGVADEIAMWREAYAALGGLLPPSADRVIEAAQADLNGDGAVDGADLGLLLAAWGDEVQAFDFNGDGTVDGADLGLLLSAWGQVVK